MTKNEGILISFAIGKLRPNAEFTMNDNDYSTIEWIVLEGKAPTQTEINAAIAQIKSSEIALSAQKATEKAALLAKLGITQEEAALLVGGN
jgi:hypothetical protein